eukprot:scaffold11.g3924.t1
MPPPPSAPTPPPVALAVEPPPPRARTLEALLLGQLLALLVATTAVCSRLLADAGVSTPTLQSSLNYLLLAIVFGTLRWRHRQPLVHPLRSYAALALLDVEANFLVVLAFRFTSLTSVTILDCFSIPTAVVLSTAFLRARYRRLHYVAAAVCVAGLSVLLAGDRSGAGGAGAGSRPLLGDGLVLLGATLYACCNVYQESLLGAAPTDEVLAMLGTFGFLVSLAQGLPLELGALRAVRWAPAVALPLLGFTAAMFVLYSLVPYQLVLGGAALLNLQLLSSDVWAAGARALFFGGFSRLTAICFVAAFGLVAAGLLLFLRAGDVATAADQPQHAAYSPLQQREGSDLERAIELESEESPLQVGEALKGADDSGANGAVWKEDEVRPQPQQIPPAAV